MSAIRQQHERATLDGMGLAAMRWTHLRLVNVLDEVSSVLRFAVGVPSEAALSQPCARAASRDAARKGEASPRSRSRRRARSCESGEASKTRETIPA